MMNSIELASGIIKEFEGYSAKPYLCPAGVPTIGYGTTVYPNGKRVSMSDPAINEPEAMEMLIHAIKEVEAQLKSVLTAQLSEHQFAALLSFTYNVGIGNLSKSTLLGLVNMDSKHPQIPFQFKRWNIAGGKVLRGLIRRRDAEVKLYKGLRIAKQV